MFGIAVSLMSFTIHVVAVIATEGSRAIMALPSTLQVFIWVGVESSENERKSAPDVVKTYLQAAKRSPDTPMATVRVS